MPIKRKICRIGTGYAIFLPKSWLDLVMERHGPVREVAIEVDDVLKISPIIREAEQK